MSDPQNALDVFVSYSHRDMNLRGELESHLSLLKNQGLIRLWTDRVITAGEEWAGEIHENLESADIILLLISPPFMASKYCYDLETKRAMERHDARQARVVPIILRPVDWRGAPFGKLQPLPEDGKPVTTWRSTDDGFYNVALGLRAAIEAEQKRRTTGSIAAGGPNLHGRPVKTPQPTSPRSGAMGHPVAPAPAGPLTCKEMRDAGYLAELASVFSTAASAYGLLDEAGVPQTRIQPFGQLTPIEFWEDVCRQLEKGLIQGGPSVLLAAAVKAYPYNSVFQKATA